MAALLHRFLVDLSHQVALVTKHASQEVLPHFPLIVLIHLNCLHLLLDGASGALEEAEVPGERHVYYDL